MAGRSPHWPAKWTGSTALTPGPAKRLYAGEMDVLLHYERTTCDDTGNLPWQKLNQSVGCQLMQCMANRCPANAQFFCSLGDGGKGIPSLKPILGTWPETDIAFTNSLSGSQFCRIVMERDRWISQYF